MSSTTPDALRVESSAQGVTLELIAKPRAGKTAVKGVQEGRLVLAVAAPPVDGAANEEIRRFLAERVGVPRRDVSIVSGETARHKRVRIVGAEASAVLQSLVPVRAG